MSQVWRGFWRLIGRIPVNPIARSTVEVFLSALFTFGPIALLATPFVPADGEFSRKSFDARFWSFFDSGEIALPVLAISGVVFAIAVLDRKILPNWLSVASLLLAMVFALSATFALSSSNGLADKLHPEIVYWGFVLYSVMAFVWLTLLIRIQASIDRGNAEERADSILSERDRLEGRGSGQ